MNALRKFIQKKIPWLVRTGWPATRSFTCLICSDILFILIHYLERPFQPIRPLTRFLKNPFTHPQTDTSGAKKTPAPENPLSFCDRMVSPAGITIIIFLTVFLSFCAYFCARKSTLLSYLSTISKLQRIPTLTPTPTPTPRPIPHGKIGFNTGQSNKDGPQMSRGFIDPYDPQTGTVQTVTITVEHHQPVTLVTAVLKTDTAVSEPIPFTLISGTDRKGEWQGSWQVHDTYFYTYALVLQATSGQATGSVEVTLR